MAQILGTGKQRAGKTARVLVGGPTGHALTYASWNIPFSGDDFVTTNFESYNVARGHTFHEGILGPLTVNNATFGGDWDAGDNPLGSTPGLYPRDDLADLSMITSRLDYAASASNALWQFAYFRVRSATNSARVGDKVTFESGGSSQGPFVWPTTNA
jgi:hypothetical protein